MKTLSVYVTAIGIIVMLEYIAMQALRIFWNNTFGLNYLIVMENSTAFYTIQGLLALMILNKMLSISFKTIMDTKE